MNSVPAPKRPACRSLSTASSIPLTPPLHLVYAGALQSRRAERDGLSATAGAQHRSINLGIADAEAWCQDKYHKTFAELSSEQQDEALGCGNRVKPSSNSCRPRCSSPICCKTPAKGSSATRSMAAIKAWSAGRLINFPGARADFMDWVERGRTLPLPAGIN
ncbi:gluconate 2-dehydrogenase subunit gamma [Klebsiella pneumoniae subsp. rhinoscleromatis]|nr:gluconate 2-dehydrogenase subunit gamma [Klebsiella pneumoniae subsp. rhinoscleromatis]